MCCDMSVWYGNYLVKDMLVFKEGWSDFLNGLINYIYIYIYSQGNIPSIPWSRDFQFSLCIRIACGAFI